MDHLINIDNGGTLTDICVWDGAGFTFTKTLTTPFDLSKCLFDGIEKASETLYGEPDLEKLLHATQHIRYSTTQGTNALVERKGPSIGILTTSPDLRDHLYDTPEERLLYDDLIGDRLTVLDQSATSDEGAFELVQSVNRLTNLGAARIVVVGRTPEDESSIRRVLLRKFPRHLLGSVPFLYSWDFVGDRTEQRRAWSCVLNSFLHPTMERFLYSAESRLREHKVINPLLVYRNDGSSSRVAKAVALKTYSSGPRGGLEGTRALAEAYQLPHVLMMDVGGTTTDVGVVTSGRIKIDPRGSVKGVPTSFPLSNVHSYGVGGSSIIAVHDGNITVGPRSVGAAPGPACFGFGGREATITDVNLLLGVLDPETYLDGNFALDASRSRAVITETVAEPLGITLEEALVRMEAAYFEATAAAFAPLVRSDTTLAAFGGAGPMSACGAAKIARVHRVLIPRMAAVFSAFGISFSDIGKNYEVGIPESSAESAAFVHDDLVLRAERDMFQEGYALENCVLEWQLAAQTQGEGDSVSVRAYERGDELDTDPQLQFSLRLSIVAVLPHPEIAHDISADPRQPIPSAVRSVRTAADVVDEVTVYTLDEQPPGASANGPAIVEGPFFSARVAEGWTFIVTSERDLILTDN